METIEFHVEGRPVPEPRKRVQIRYRQGQPYPHHYADKNTGIDDYKKAVNLRARLARPSGWSLDGPMCCRVAFVMPRKADSKQPFRQWCGGHFDIDNLTKGVWDAMKGIVWNDDNQVVDVTAFKVYASIDEQPHTEVSVWHAENQTE